MKTNRLWYGNGQNVSKINARFRCYECVFLIFNRLACHSIFAANSTGDSVCVVADDTDVFILLLYLSVKCHVTLYFRQGTNSSKDGVTYHNVTALSSHFSCISCFDWFRFHQRILQEIKGRKLQNTIVKAGKSWLTFVHEYRSCSL